MFCYLTVEEQCVTDQDENDEQSDVEPSDDDEFEEDMRRLDDMPLRFSATRSYDMCFRAW